MLRKILGLSIMISVLNLNLYGTGIASAQSSRAPSGLPILADLKDLQTLRIPVYAQDLVSQVGIAFVTPEMQSALQEHAHHNGKCGGYEALMYERNPEDYLIHLRILQRITKRHSTLARMPWRRIQIEKNPQYVAALNDVQETNIRDSVQWLSSFKTRNEKSPTANDHVLEMKARIEKMIPSNSFPVQVDLINHSRTKQKSLRVRLIGSKRPQEIVVLGGHHDSVNLSWSGNGHAPGADDNASGTSNLLEITRILLAQKQPERTIEIMWYAAEESGLVGSSEIARAYRGENADVVGVLQLDMTSYPGSGEMTIVNLTDFTHPWMQNFLKELNSRYVGLNILDDRCGYGCSDHASWHRQNYPTVVPFESRNAQMNPNIHTARDILSPTLSFRHSAAIAKLSLAFALELGNSTLRVPELNNP